MKLIEALEGLEMKEGDDFPQGDKMLRKEDHQAFLREFIFEIKGGKYRSWTSIPKEKTIVPPACKFAVGDCRTSFIGAAPRPAPAGGALRRPILAHRGPDRPLRRADRAQRRQLRGRDAARSAPSSARTAPARARSSTA